MNIVLKLFRIRLKACSFTIMLMTLLKIMDSHMIVLILEYGSASKNLFVVTHFRNHQLMQVLPLAYLMPHTLHCNHYRNRTHTHRHLSGIKRPDGLLSFSRPN